MPFYTSLFFFLFDGCDKKYDKAGKHRILEVFGTQLPRALEKGW